MELLTAELRASLPRLYSQENTDDPVVHCKFFTPWSNWTWFATEGEPDEEDFRFFGYVCGHEEEWGENVEQISKKTASSSLTSE